MVRWLVPVRMRLVRLLVGMRACVRREAEGDVRANCEQEEMMAEVFWTEVKQE